MNMKLATKLSTLAVLAALTTFANARTVTVSMDSTQVLSTMTGGPEKLQFAYSNTLYWPGGMNTVANQTDAGYKGDKGSDDFRLAPTWNMVDVTMRPGQTSETVVALYATTGGTYIDPLLDMLRSAGSTSKKSPSTSLRNDLSLGGLAACNSVSQMLANGEGFVGSVRINLECKSDGSISWSVQGLDHATYVSYDGRLQSFIINNGRGAFMMKFGVAYTD